MGIETGVERKKETKEIEPIKAYRISSLETYQLKVKTTCTLHFACL